MSTNGRIAIKHQDGTLVSVYHHWDSYPEWLGVTLEKKFNTKESIEKLISGGDMSSCDSDTDWNRNQLKKSKPCYYSERGECCPPRTSKSIKELIEINCGQEFAYVFDVTTNKWQAYEVLINFAKDDSYSFDYKEVAIPKTSKYVEV